MSNQTEKNGAAHEPSKAKANGSQGKKSDTDEIVQLGMQGVELWHDKSSGRTFATIQIDSHAENYCLDSQSFQRYLESRFYFEHQKAAPANSVTNAIATLKAKALFEGKEHTPRLRVAGMITRFTSTRAMTSGNQFPLMRTAMPSPPKRRLNSSVDRE